MHPGQRTAKVQLPAPENRSFLGYTKGFHPRKQPRVSTNSDPVFRVVSLSRSNAIWNAKRTQARRLLSGSARLAALSARGSGGLRGALRSARAHLTSARAIWRRRAGLERRREPSRGECRRALRERALRLSFDAARRPHCPRQPDLSEVDELQPRAAKPVAFLRSPQPAGQDLLRDPRVDGGLGPRKRHMF